jgi:hypothetical protein
MTMLVSTMKSHDQQVRTISFVILPNKGVDLRAGNCRTVPFEPHRSTPLLGFSMRVCAKEFAMKSNKKNNIENVLGFARELADTEFAEHDLAPHEKPKAMADRFLGKMPEIWDALIGKGGVGSMPVATKHLYIAATSEYEKRGGIIDYRLRSLLRERLLAWYENNVQDKQSGDTEADDIVIAVA